MRFCIGTGRVPFSDHGKLFMPCVGPRLPLTSRHLKPRFSFVGLVLGSKDQPSFSIRVFVLDWLPQDFGHSVVHNRSPSLPASTLNQPTNPWRTPCSDPSRRLFHIYLSCKWEALENVAFSNKSTSFLVYFEGSLNF